MWGKPFKPEPWHLQNWFARGNCLERPIAWSKPSRKNCASCCVLEATRMRRIEFLGPSLVVFAAAGVLLLVGPTAVRQVSKGIVASQMNSAQERLHTGSLLDQMSQASRDVAIFVEPSVVHVSSSGDSNSRSGRRNFINSGSGWVYDDDGHIVTNAHVVEGATRLEVQMVDGERREAKLLGTDLRTDIAVLQVDAQGLVPARRATQDPQQGDMVFAFGSPFDFRFSMSNGIVSGLGRAAGISEIEYENFIQTDAAINPGNSGGPLTNTKGHVVGMTTAIATGQGNGISQGQFAGIGLAIPISMIDNVVDQLIDHGEVVKGYLGVSMRDMEEISRMRMRDPLLQTTSNMFQGDGAAIVFVSPLSPAEIAGLRVGDIVTQFAGQRIQNASQLRSMIASRQPNERISIDLWRPDALKKGGDMISLQVVMGQLKPETNSDGIVEALRNVGIKKLITATDAAAQQFGVAFERGVMVEEVVLGSSVSDIMPPGTMIVEVFGQKINNLDDFYTRITRQIQASRRLEFILVLGVRQPNGSVERVLIPLQ
ncbi:MAG: PDZ domain-containing protein [Phycisphaerales bacterium]|nr:PDZ domain-containing protein [Phycisphaerales bacterium]